MKDLRFTFVADELMQLKLKSLTGSNFLKNNDFQRLMTILINQTYDKSNGKKIK